MLIETGSPSLKSVVWEVHYSIMIWFKHEHTKLNERISKLKAFITSTAIFTDSIRSIGSRERALQLIISYVWYSKYDFHPHCQLFELSTTKWKTRGLKLHQRKIKNKNDKCVLKKWRKHSEQWHNRWAANSCWTAGTVWSWWKQAASIATTLFPYLARSRYSNCTRPVVV